MLERIVAWLKSFLPKQKADPIWWRDHGDTKTRRWTNGVIEYMARTSIAVGNNQVIPPAPICAQGKKIVVNFQAAGSFTGREHVSPVAFHNDGTRCYIGFCTADESVLREMAAKKCRWNGPDPKGFTNATEFNDALRSVNSMDRLGRVNR